jgi:hypothetical protein
MSDRWTHVICETCWREKNPGRAPHRLLYEKPAEACCYCGRRCKGDIVVREDPDVVACGGEH